MKDNNSVALGKPESSQTLTVSSCSTFVLLICTLVVSLFITINTHAQDSAQSTKFSLTSKTKQCVALRQGQACYKKINFQWKADTNNDYCVIELESRKIIQCWQQQNNGSVNVEFESDSDTTYVLRQQGDTEDLASTEIKISWVYKPKSEKSSGWRLF